MAGAVMLLDDDPDLRAVFSEVVADLCGRECLVVGSFDEMVAAADAVLACGVALLDVNLGPGRPTGIHAWRWLTDRGFRGRLYFFTGHARGHPLLAEIETLGAVEVLSKPLDAARLMEVLA